ncbi:hypothetical protein HUG17_10039 [Dermatophagoides farinae]|uniref:Peptidase S1 domain-containing protein n=1 Tax=Dermatophagoides farinae TaxID=6954 RepID=A0A9D4P3R4_DERFA|nr:hypothetical protein HUG17_10039 [Dermatophagoides farinae]
MSIQWLIFSALIKIALMTPNESRDQQTTNNNDNNNKNDQVIREFSDKHNHLTHRWPFMAALKDYQSGKIFCTGVLIGYDLVMTAAQCLERTESNGIKLQRTIESYRVLMNCDNIHSHGCHSYHPEIFAIHDKHMDVLHLNDLAIIKLNIPIPDNLNISMFAHFIPKIKYNEVMNRLDLSKCSIVGYGYPSKSEIRQLSKKQKREITRKSSGTLHAIHVSTMNPDDEPQSGQICALYEGDHGSPLICPSLDGNNRIIGMMTHQLTMREQDHQFAPALFTNLSKHEHWILSSIRILKALKNSKHFEKWLFYREQHPNKNDNDNIHIRQSHYSAYTFIVFLPIVISVAFIIAENEENTTKIIIKNGIPDEYIRMTQKFT